MRPLEKLLEPERAAGLCDLEATPSGKAMRDRVWARTQASIMSGRGDPDFDAPVAARPAVTWGWKTILFATFVLAVAPAVVSFAGRTSGDSAPGERNALPSAAVVAEVAPPSQAEVPSGIDAVSVNALPSAPPPTDAPSSPQAKRARAPLPNHPVGTAASARTRELAAPGPVGESDQLDLERRLLDQVRHGLATRDYASAGATLRTYENTFGDGQLAEEEQALKIRWLAASGQGDAAREMAARFKERFPNSFFRPAVERAARGTLSEGKGP
ncbi:MAG: hypothetical protein BGO98_33970 [Myxococcales bacterium 68-20]|nr:hypothetical protein [Myxococcales bacterium]OJY25634.1 MAG: hypothetical protein BGO98_33970 [Myxococcales bacterium 68-20]